MALFIAEIDTLRARADVHELEANKRNAKKHV